MDKKIILVLLLISTCLLTSCETYRLSKKDKEWQPYRVGDTLIFHSSMGEVDTVHVGKIESYINPQDQLNLFATKYQTIFVGGKRSIMRLGVGVGNPHIRFDLRLGENKMRYPLLMRIRVSDIKDSTDIVNFGNFKECFRITAVDSDDDWVFDLCYIYWCKELGYIGLEFKNGLTWELKEFRRKGKNILDEYR